MPGGEATGHSITLNCLALLWPALVVTVTSYTLAKISGTCTTICVLLHASMDKDGTRVALKATVLPCPSPKSDPVIVTEVPTGPVMGERLAIIGAGDIVKMIERTATLRISSCS